MQGKTVLVTGATDGIGLVTARVLAERGATVIVAGRDGAKGERVVRALRQRTGNEWVSFQRADLSIQGDVRRLARNVAEAHPRLDVLVNNAGAIFRQRRVSADGLEMTFALNHLGYFLLTSLLLPRLRESAPARIVNVASRAHEGAALDFDDLQGERGYNGWRAYQRSKLANILFTYELARRLDGSDITANALHPGFVATAFGNNNGPLYRLTLGLAKQIMAIDEEAGALTQIHLAASPEVKGVSGRYFVKSRPADSSPQSRDEAAQRRLWEISERLTGG